MAGKRTTDIELPNQSGFTDIAVDRDVSTGNARTPTKSVAYRTTPYPIQRTGESDATFKARAAFQNPGEAELARRAKPSRSVTGRR